jgi:hypothetical protein
MGRCEVVGTGSISCLTAYFGISGVEPSGSAIAVFARSMHISAQCNM